MNHYATINPFPGLRPFRTDEHHLFFGREDQVAELLSLLRQHRFLAVVGTSGSGKSSLVRAGLIPALHRGTMSSAGSSWEVVILRPGGDPVSNLAKALLEAELYDARDPESFPRLKATLGRSLYGLTEAVRQSSSFERGANLLVVVDQFEELFRFRRLGADSEEAASAFVRLLLAASQSQDQRIYVAITMRSDYLGDCSQIPGLAEAVNDGEYLIPRLTRDQKRDAIESPVGVGGARIAQRLVQRMLNDVGDDPDQLPVLQHALMRTWDARAAVGELDSPIDLEHYEGIGGMEEALSRHADEVYARLAITDSAVHVSDILRQEETASQPADLAPEANPHLDACARIFKALTEKGADNRGVRRPMRLDRLVAVVGADRSLVITVIEAFRSHGVTFLMPGPEQPLTDRTVIDLSHESLMRVWTRLRAWVDEEAQSARIYHRLSETAQLWKEGKAGLFRDPDLQIAMTWRQKVRPTADWAELYGGAFEPAMEFLDKSNDTARAEEHAREQSRRRELEQAKALAEAEGRRAEERQRAAKRLKFLAAGVAAVAVVAIVASIFAVAARREAIRSANRANEKELAATELAARLKTTAVEGDFKLGVERIEAGDGSAGLAHLARAMRTDPNYWPASVRTMSTLASGRYSLETLGEIEQTRVITKYEYNEKEDLIFTSDVQNNPPADAVTFIPERYMWDAITGKKLYAVGQGVKNLIDLEWSADGKHFFMHFPAENILRGFESRTGKETASFHTPQGVFAFYAGHIPEHGDVILTEYATRAAFQVWKVSTGKPLSPLMNRVSTKEVGFTPGGRVFAVHTDKTIAVYDPASGDVIHNLSTEPYIAAVGQVRFSPDDRFVVVNAEGSKNAYWWNLAESKGMDSVPAKWIEFTYTPDAWFLPSLERVCFHGDEPNGKMRVDVFDLNPPRRVTTLQSEGPVAGIFYRSEEPKRYRTLRFPLFGIVSGNRVRIWDLETGKVLQEILTPAVLGEADANRVRWWNRDAIFSPDGRTLATIAIDHNIMLWDVFTGKPLLASPIEHQGRATVAFSPSGEKLVTHDRDRRLFRFWDPRTGRQIAEPVSQITPSDLHFTSRGNRLILHERGSVNVGNIVRQVIGRLRIVDLGMRPAVGEPLFGIHANQHQAAAQFTPDGKKILVFGKPGTSEPDQIRVYENSSHRQLLSLPLPGIIHTDGSAMAVSPDSHRVVLGAEDGIARIWDLESGKLVHQLAHEGPVHRAEFNADGSRLLTTTSQGRLYIWNTVTGNTLTEPVATGALNARKPKIHPRGGIVAAGTLDYKLRILSADTGKDRIEPIEIPGSTDDLAFSSDGDHLAVIPFAREVLIVETTSGKVLRKLSHRDFCRIGAFSPDGRILAVGTGLAPNLPTGEITLWDWKEGRVIIQGLNAKGPVHHLAFSRDGSMLASGTILPTGGAVQVWDVSTGLALSEAIVGTSPVTSVSFDSSGAHLLAAWNNGMVRIIDLPPHQTPIPDWLPRLAEAVAGQRLQSTKAGFETVGREEIGALRTLLAPTQGTDAATAWGRWLFADPATRSLAAGSSTPITDYIEGIRRGGSTSNLEEALRLAPTDALAHARFGLALLDQSNAQYSLDVSLRRHWGETAEWYNRRAVELAPSDLEAWAWRVNFLLRVGGAGSRKAADALTRAVEINESAGQSASANIYYLQAKSLANEGKWSQADAAFAKSLERISAAPGAQESVALIPGPLSNLTPYRTRAGFRDIRLPDPIPGAFESFDAMPRGQFPDGWSVRVEVAKADNVSSAVFVPSVDWLVMSADADAFGANLLSLIPAKAEARYAIGRINGVLITEDMKGGFLLAGAESGRARVRTAETPDFDCKNRKDIHLVFNSSFLHKPGAFSGIEYSVDQGASWLPISYLLDSSHLLRDSAGNVDAAGTLKKARAEIPTVLSAAGKERGGAYGAFVSAAIDQSLASILSGQVETEEDEPVRRLEVYRLPRADGQAKVRVRFTQLAKPGAFWAIDRVGLYEMASPDLEKRPEFLIRTDEPSVLARVGLRAAHNGYINSVQYSWLTGEDLASAPWNWDQAPTAGERTSANINARLLLRRALALSPDDPLIHLAASLIEARAGEIDVALARARKALERRPFDAYSASVMAALLIELADTRPKADANSAAAAYEMAYVLIQAAFPTFERSIPHRISRAIPDAGSAFLIGRGTDWKYYFEQAAPDPAWKNADFNDTAWQHGPGRLGFGGDGEVTLLKIPAGPRQPPAAYFRHEFKVDDPSRYRSLRLGVVRDDGVVIYLNGQEVGRDNMPGGDITHGTFAVKALFTTADEQDPINIPIPSRHLQKGKNVIAAEVHQSNSTSSDIGFDLELEAAGTLYEPKRPFEELDAADARLNLSNELRALLWISRASRYRKAERLDLADKSLARFAQLIPNSPRVAYEQAMLQLARHDEETAYKTYIQAAQAASKLRKTINPAFIFLPAALRSLANSPADPTARSLAAMAVSLSQEGMSENQAEAIWLLRWAAQLDSKDPFVHRQSAEFYLDSKMYSQALAAVDALLAALPALAADPPARRLEIKDLLRLKEQCLDGLGRRDDAAKVRLEIFKAPPRDPALGPRLVDLSGHYNASIYDGRGWHSSDILRSSLRTLPTSFQPRHNVNFDLRGIIQLNSGPFVGDSEPRYRDRDVNQFTGRSFPDQVTGIPAGFESPAIHFLLSTNYGRTIDGEEVARFIVHYSDGTNETVPIRFNMDVIDWARLGSQTLGPAKIGWEDATIGRHLSEVIWQNPNPKKTISHIDFVSGKKPAAPFLTAITAE